MISLSSLQSERPSRITQLAAPEVSKKFVWDPSLVITDAVFEEITQVIQQRMESEPFDISAFSSAFQMAAHLNVLFPHRDIGLIYSNFSNGLKRYLAKLDEAYEDGKTYCEFMNFLADVATINQDLATIVLEERPSVQKIVSKQIIDMVIRGEGLAAYRQAAKMSLAYGKLFDVKGLNDDMQPLRQMLETLQTYDWHESQSPFFIVNTYLNNALPIRLFMPEVGSIRGKGAKDWQHLLEIADKAQYDLTRNMLVPEVVYYVTLLTAEKVELTPRGLDIVRFGQGQNQIEQQSVLRPLPRKEYL